MTEQGEGLRMTDQGVQGVARAYRAKSRPAAFSERVISCGRCRPRTQTMRCDARSAFRRSTAFWSPALDETSSTAPQFFARGCAAGLFKDQTAKGTRIVSRYLRTDAGERRLRSAVSSPSTRTTARREPEAVASRPATAAASARRT